MSEETQFYPLPFVLAEDFAEFAEILRDDGDFPSTHAGWVALSHARSAELDEDSYTPKFIQVRPAGFRLFMKESGGAASMNSLAAYAALLASDKR